MYTRRIPAIFPSIARLPRPKSRISRSLSFPSSNLTLPILASTSAHAFHYSRLQLDLIKAVNSLYIANDRSMSSESSTSLKCTNDIPSMHRPHLSGAYDHLWAFSSDTLFNYVHFRRRHTNHTRTRTRRAQSGDSRRSISWDATAREWWNSWTQARSPWRGGAGDAV
ncbi:hypothetical protein PIIN_10203 [Serendipita indica DSM 11827]|uniref:Uncharacterized protein n=1 Tax=Serendipita indica (strain DSM 11827) TaxID=1109443 RepID=G4TY17_SERID|nr:hypothetical protein PIIN_10203 [Serendipita indica DSM 11827]